MNRALRNLLLPAVLLATGCAETKYAMRLDPEPRSGGGAPVWPAAPDAPRFRYVGQLLGEQNFVAEAGDTRGAGMKLLHWLVGMFGDGEERITLKRPQSGVVDAEGRVYVTDPSNQAVLVFDRPAGKLRLWKRAQENLAFVTPVGIALGGDGQILVADADLARVFRLDRNGAALGSFGEGVLKRPTGLARDGKRGKIYVADTHAHDIKVFDDGGRLLELIGHRGDGDAELNFPTHLAFANDKLYVTDGMNARVQVYDAHGELTATVGRRGLFIGEFTRPKGITVDASGNIFVVESFYDNLLVFDGAGNFLMPIGGTGKGIGQFYLPAGLWNDALGRIYVADMFNGRVVIFQSIGEAQ